MSQVIVFDLKRYDYFEKFLNDEDWCILDVIVERNQYVDECLNLRQRSAFLEEMIENRSPKIK